MKYAKRRMRKALSFICSCTMLSGVLSPVSEWGILEISAAEGEVIEISTPEELAKIGKDRDFPMTGGLCTDGRSGYGGN